MRRDGHHHSHRSRVLCVGKRAQLALSLRSAIANEYVIEHTSDPAAALTLLSLESYTITVLDQAQRGSFCGLQLAHDIRKERPWIGIILCVADRQAAMGWRALSEACDDYLIKPYRAVELTARLRTVAARSSSAPKAAAILEWGPLRLDFVRQTVFVFGRETALQPLQLRLLGYLVQHAGRLVPREELQLQVFRVSQHHGSTSLARQVSVLRKQLGAVGALISTYRSGYGIGLVDPPDRSALPAPRRPTERDRDERQP